MIPFAQYLRGLASDGDLVTIDESADVPPDVVAAEALRASGPALRYRRADGVDLASGMFSGPDQMQRRESKSWSRLALGFGLSPDASFVAVLDTIAGLGPSGGDADPTYAGQTASRTVDSVQDLNLPQGTEDVWPSLTLGVASVSSSEGHTGHRSTAPSSATISSACARRPHCRRCWTMTERSRSRSACRRRPSRLPTCSP